MNETGDVRQAWARVTAWLERNDPRVFASLGGPGSQEAIGRAELCMGLELPEQVRQWLLANDVDATGRPDAPNCLVEQGCAVPVPGGCLLLGLGDIQRVYLHRLDVERMEPSEVPDCPSWRPEWVPIAADRDGLHGTFLDTVEGTVGRWAEASVPEEGVYASLSAFFQAAADLLEGVSTGDWRGPGTPVRPREPDEPRPEDEPIRRWARTNGLSVNDRGRIPSSIREAYEVSRR
ncbi:histone-like nucleoid-structuring protein Lsr2 [Kitasatospora sp. NPDC097691]|uniref:Lsr2 family DNA-binding protein n=1 Tax=Kitasatospora sp. NPDC097691 TaxID=3157231 RepID=UPI003326678E